MTRYGYARVSHSSQNHDRQLETLRKTCERIVCETITGPEAEKPLLEGLLDELGPGDVIVFHELDRIARSTLEFLRLVARLDEAGIGVEVLSPQIDLSGKFGRAIASILMVFAELELTQSKKRQREGIERARAKGVRFGAPPKLTRARLDHARELQASGRTQRDIADILGVSLSTINRALRGQR